MKIALASDHAGYLLKEKIKQYLLNKSISIEDFGAFSEESIDYPDTIHPAAQSVDAGYNDYGIILCGSGQGAMITANKHPNVRAALPWNIELAKLSREHNNANIITIAARFINESLAYQMIDTFLNTSFEGGRHLKRVNKIPI